MRAHDKQAPMIGISIIGSLVAFILVTLALFSGNQQGFMEDYNIITFNTSELGKNLVPTSTGNTQASGTSKGCDTGISIIDKGCSAVASAAGSVESQVAGALSGIENDLADKLAQKLGIKEFYSLHVMDLCEGNFAPNATAAGAVHNVTSCSPALKTAQYNVTALFDHELGVGPLKLNLADLGFTKDLADDFDKLPETLEAVGVIFILAMAFSGLSLCASVVGVFTAHVPAVCFVNIALAGLAFLALVIGSAVATAGALKAESKINEHGSGIGLSANAGRKFMAITWSATALMLVSLVAWASVWIRNRRLARRARAHGSKREGLFEDDVKYRAAKGRSRV